MYPSEAELLLQLWGPVGIQAWISQQTWSNYLSLPLKHSALLQPKNLTSHEVPGSHKLCSLAYLLINIYIYFTFPSLCWLVLHLSIWLRAKKNPCLKNINMPFTLVCYLFIYFFPKYQRSGLIWMKEHQAGGKAWQICSSFSWHGFNTSNLKGRGSGCNLCCKTANGLRVEVFANTKTQRRHPHSYFVSQTVLHWQERPMPATIRKVYMQACF